MGHIRLGVVLLHVNACLLMTQEVSITNLRNYVHTYFVGQGVNDEECKVVN
jgi:hypothetical protein